MSRSNFLDAVQRDGLGMACMYAAMVGVPMAQTQLWIRSI